LPPFSDVFPESDVIVATYWPTAYEVARIKAKRKFYLVQHYEPVFYAEGSENFEIAKNSYRLSLEPIVVSKWLQDRLKKEFGLDSDYVPNAIDSGLFNAKTESPRKNIISLLFVVADYAHFKGVPDALEAFRRLKRRKSGLKGLFLNRDHKIKITFVTTQPKLPKGAGSLIDRFISNPSQPELASIYKDHDIFVHSSLCEGFALPPLEAMACGCAVAATDSGGIRDFASHGENCLLAPPRQPEKLAETVNKLIIDHNLRQKLSDRAVATAAKFQWEKSIDLLEQLFKGDKQ